MRRFGNRVRAPSILAAVAGMVVVARPAALHAQSDTEAALAEALYRQARELMAADKYDEACPKFAESYRLDRGTGTLLNLAACHEHQGKLASAWLEYSDGVVAARRDERPDRVKFAEDHLVELEPKLSRVTLIVPPEADVPGLEIRLDGAPIGVAARGVPAPVDPGPHVVEANAPGKQTFTQNLVIGALADRQTVTIPKLADAPPAAAAPLPEPAAQPMSMAPPPAMAPGDAAADRPTPTSVYVLGGATLALGTAAIVTGAIYLGERSSFKSASDSGVAQDHYDTARSLGIANAVLWGATACGAGVTAYLYFTRPAEPRSERASAIVAPWIAPGSAGLAAHGAF